MDHDDILKEESRSEHAPSNQTSDEQMDGSIHINEDESPLKTMRQHDDFSSTGRTFPYQEGKAGHKLAADLLASNDYFKIREGST